MKTKNRVFYYFFFLVLFVPLMSFFAFRFVEENFQSLPYYRNEGLIDENNESHYQIPAFSFLNKDSSGVNQNELKGKIGLINYFFTSCPTICPKMMDNLKKLDISDNLSSQIEIISLTVDPKHDTPHKLTNYYKKLDVNKRNWELLTGNKEELYRFARKGIFLTASDGDGGPSDFIHSEKITLIDYNKHIRGYYDGTDQNDMKRLIKDIKKLIKMEPLKGLKT